MNGYFPLKKKTVVAILWVIIAGCQNAASSAYGDGIAPYRPAADLEMCLEYQRLWPLDELGEGPTGLCTAVNIQPQTCANDAGCAEREACVCGRCMLQLCKFSSECRDGTVCTGSPLRCSKRCNEDTECGGSEICEQGACIPSCGDARDCAYGELCLVGHCAALGCSGAVSVCGGNETCSLQRQGMNLYAPSVLTLEEQVVLYLRATDSMNAARLFRGISVDGTRFVLDSIEGVELDDSALSSRMGVQSVNDGVWLYYTVAGGHEVQRSFSSDGQHFAHEETVLKATRLWEDNRIHSPTIVNIEGVPWLFYVGGENAGIGAAMQTADGTWQRVDDKPVLTVDNVQEASTLLLWQDITEITDPWPVFYTNTLGRRELRLYFAALGRERLGDSLTSLASSNYSVGLARWNLLTDTDAGVDFQAHPYNPILARRLNLTELDERYPAVLMATAKGLMYFSERGRIFLAINDGKPRISAP